MLNVDRKIIMSLEKFFFLSLEFQKMTSAPFDFMLFFLFGNLFSEGFADCFFSVSLSKYLQCSV